jgi:glyoxylase-like metal-dependent hydrolase (beta-lactamase superfamily II)
MKIKQFTDRFYYLAGPFFVFYAASGDERLALIELGISQLVPQALHDIREGLGGREPDILIAPHGHFDHAGASSRWKKELPGAVLCGSARTASVLADESSLPPYLRSMQSSSSMPFFKDVFPLAEDDAFIEPVAFDRILKEGDIVDLGGIALEVHETPGHSACSISLFHRESRTLFCSDACGLPLPSGRIWPSAFLDKEIYKNSILKMKSLNPEHVCSGHNPPMSGAERNRRFFDKNLDSTDNFFARIEKLWAELKDKEAVQKALFEDYKNDGAEMLAFVFKYGNKEMVRQVADGVQGRG